MAMKKFSFLSAAARNALGLAAADGGEAPTPAPAPSEDEPAGDPPADPAEEEAPAGDPPAETPPAGTAPAAPAATAQDGVTFSAADLAGARTVGFTEATDRMSAVFESDAGKANPAMAAWMLGAAGPDATAASIISKLATAPAAAGTGSALSSTGIKLALGGGEPEADEGKSALDNYYADRDGAQANGTVVVPTAHIGSSLKPARGTKTGH